MEKTDGYADASRPKPDRREYWKQYHAKNRERANAYKLAYYYRNREKELQRLKKWQAENPERVRAQQKAYRDRMRDARIAYCREYRRRLKTQRDPIAAAKRLLAKASEAARYGYTGKLTPGGL